jgi:hypothetical protein
MTVEFRYREEELEITGKILRPVAALQFKSRNGEWIEIRMYIDSGADMTLIPLSFGRLLGLELRKEDIKHLRGVGGGEVPVIITKVDIRMMLNFQLTLHGRWKRMFHLCLGELMYLIGLGLHLIKVKGSLYLRIKVI